ncbi:MAG TPA: hypothetical protein VK968_15745 [Roseimicrobium sp.]|nr:hypothetical protein [Roseimicrobium sp.]
MIAKYHIEYEIPFRSHNARHDYKTDDPVACVAFLSELIERGLVICSIKHEGVDLSRTESDRLIRNAAEQMVSRHVQRSLGINAEESKYRFGFAG